MKFLIVLALCVAAATARFELPDVVAAEAAEIQQILDLIQHPNTDPATAAALQALLDEILAPAKPVEEGISVGPVIIDNEDLHEIDVSPVIVDPVAPDAPAAPAASSPLVSIIINVNSGSSNAVSIEDSPVVPRPEPVEEDVDTSPVIVVDEPEAPVEPVIVEPIVIPDPVVVLPDTLN
ncbi:protein FraH-like [Melitaea cinxia]|uniref:protein FraH-like n=1 Tax=Melitaea cinxia TaxID=113334 RepID=UPI001E274C08|nr:protein FraH-like [Melitaea cinxia]